MSSTARKRKVLSFEDKLAILNAVSAGEKKKDVATRFSIPASTLSTILSAEHSIRNAVESGTSSKKKRLKLSTYTDVDKAVFTWFLDTRARNVPISGAILQQKAKDFACILGHDDFKASNGWLQGFKSRHGVVGRVISGESASADSDAAASWVADKLPGILSRFEAADVYNADETALFYQMLPGRTLALKGDDCRGGKQSKLRITILLCANLDGTDKRVPLVVSKSAHPRCFKGTKRMPVKYVANSKAWMTRPIFSEWLKEFNQDVKRQGRQVCLLLDNCSAHHVEGLQLSNIELHYFPANCTSLIQPLDKGVINSFKCCYRRRLILKILLNIRLEREMKIDIYQAVEMLAASWQEVRAEVIANCFLKAGIAKNARAGADEEEEDLSTPSNVAEAWNELCTNGGVPDDVELTDFLFADNAAVTTEEMSDAAVAESVQNPDGGDDGACEADPCDVPTAKEVMNAMDVMRRFVGSLDDEGALHDLASLERRVVPTLVPKKQAEITQFFSVK
ncbi:tigger transposable element-derived protein 6-like [Dermacentor andersoni]|uniref:tigger transposable element-derived protein 6-like n=1 Tax=Dermacentor andersoni TaxID=34620 RepID=UPI003B3B1264